MSVHKFVTLCKHANAHTRTHPNRRWPKESRQILAIIQAARLRVRVHIQVGGQMRIAEGAGQMRGRRNTQRRPAIVDGRRYGLAVECDRTLAAARHRAQAADIDAGRIVQARLRMQHRARANDWLPVGLAERKCDRCE